MEFTAIRGRHERKGFLLPLATSYASLGHLRCALQCIIAFVMATKGTCYRQVCQDVPRPGALSSPRSRACSGCLCPFLGCEMLTNLCPYLFTELWAPGEGPRAHSPRLRPYHLIRPRAYIVTGCESHDA